MLFDFIFAFAFFGSVAKGYIKGFSRTIFNLIVFVLTVIIALSLFDTVGDLFLDTEIGNDFSKHIANEIQEIVDIHKEKPENAPYLSSMLKLSTEGKDIDVSQLSKNIADDTVKTLIMIPLAILIIVLFNVGFAIVKKIVSKVPGHSLLGAVDKLLGSVCGLVYGIVIVGVLFLVTSFLQFIPSGNFLNEQFNSSAIVILINDLLF